MKLSNLLISLAAIAPAILAGPLIEVNNDKLHRTRMVQAPGDAFDNSRIQDYPDKNLLGLIGQYFTAYASGDFDGIYDMQADEYHMTDTPLAIVRSPKSDWYEQNRGFSSLLTDVQVQAISIDGSAEPGKFSIMEHVMWFTMAVDPPEEAKPNLPPGIKKGDRTGMIKTSVLWWNAEGKVTRELEYGRLVWDNFDIDAFKN